MSQKILVLGSTGTIGRNLVDELVARNADFVAAVRAVEKTANFGDKNVATVVVDIEDDNSLNQAMTGVKTLFLLLPPLEFDEGLRIGKSIINIAKQQGVQHVVQLSSMAAEKYKASYHYSLEQLLVDSGLGWTILRPNFMMQNFTNYYHNDIVDDKLIKLYDGDTKTSFVDARDVAAVAAVALINPEQHSHKYYTLTGSEQLNHQDLASIISAELEQKISCQAQSHDDTRAALRASQWPDASIDRLVALYKMVQEGDFSEVSSDVKTVINKDPVVFKTFVQDSVKANLF